MDATLKVLLTLGTGLFLGMTAGCSSAQNEEGDVDEGALEEHAVFSFDTASAKERAGEVDLKNAYWAARLSKVAYEFTDAESLNTKLGELGISPKEAFPFHAGDSKGWLQSRELTGTDGFYFRTDKAGFLVFRGSENGKYNDAIADARVFQINAGPMANRSSTGEMHAGFYHSLHAVWDNGLRDKLVERHADKRLPLYIAGHSLGGALGTVAAHHLLYDACLHNKTRHFDVIGYCESEYVPVAGLYTFGSPRTGDQDYATDLVKRFRETNTKVFRFVNEGDQVSMVPRYSPVAIVSAYRHIGEDGDEKALAVFLDMNGNIQPKPRGICAENPALVQCDPALSDLVGGLINGKPFWHGEHSMDIYLEKAKGLVGAKDANLDKLRSDLKAAGQY